MFRQLLFLDLCLICGVSCLQILWKLMQWVNLSGCEGGLGRGGFQPSGVGGGAGHGGKGGQGYFKGSYSKGGTTYGNSALPCEFGSGSGSGNATHGNYTAGGGIIGVLLVTSC